MPSVELKFRAVQFMCSRAIEAIAARYKSPLMSNAEYLEFLPRAQVLQSADDDASRDQSCAGKLPNSSREQCDNYSVCEQRLLRPTTAPAGGPHPPDCSIGQAIALRELSSVPAASQARSVDTTKRN